MAIHRKNGKEWRNQQAAAPLCWFGVAAFQRVRGKNAVESVRSPLRVLNPIMMHSSVFFSNLAESPLKFRQTGFSSAFGRDQIRQKLNKNQRFADILGRTRDAGPQALSALAKGKVLKSHHLPLPHGNSDRALPGAGRMAGAACRDVMLEQLALSCGGHP
jgi:hypothetical protein